MTNHKWEKRYSFRLTNGDEELKEFLDKVPNSKGGEVIRSMLRYAYKNIMKEQREQKELQDLKLEIEKLHGIITDNHKQILKKLEDGVIMRGSSTKEEENKISDDAVEDTAMSIFSSFGMDLNLD